MYIHFLDHLITAHSQTRLMESYLALIKLSDYPWTSVNSYSINSQWGYNCSSLSRHSTIPWVMGKKGSPIFLINVIHFDEQTKLRDIIFLPYQNTVFIYYQCVRLQKVHSWKAWCQLAEIFHNKTVFRIWIQLQEQLEQQN